MLPEFTYIPMLAVGPCIDSEAIWLTHAKKNVRHQYTLPGGALHIGLQPHNQPPSLAGTYQPNCCMGHTNTGWYCWAHPSIVASSARTRHYVYGALPPQSPKPSQYRLTTPYHSIVPLTTTPYHSLRHAPMLPCRQFSADSWYCDSEGPMTCMLSPAWPRLSREHRC